MFGCQVPSGSEAVSAKMVCAVVRFPTFGGRVLHVGTDTNHLAFEILTLAEMSILSAASA